MNIRICVLSGDAKVNAFAQATDIFHPSKAYAKVSTYTATAKQDYDAKNVIDGFVNASRQAGERVVAVFIVGEYDHYYVDPSVVSVSDGKKWYLLKNFMRLNGFEDVKRLEAA